MQVDRPFAVITPTLDGDVLAALAYRRGVGSTAGQLQYLLPTHSTHGVRRVLRRLVEQGVVLSRPVGNTHEYRLNRDHLATPAIIAIASARSRLVRRIAVLLGRWPTPPVYAALLGPAARVAHEPGEPGASMTPGERIDVFIAYADGTTDDDVAKGVAALAAAIRAWTGNAVDIFGVVESAAPARTSDAALRQLRDPHGHVRVLGWPSWVEQQFRLAAQSQSRLRNEP